MKHLTSLNGVHLWQGAGFYGLADDLGNYLCPTMTGLDRAVYEFLIRIPLRAASDVRIASIALGQIADGLAADKQPTALNGAPFVADIRHEGKTYRRKVSPTGSTLRGAEIGRVLLNGRGRTVIKQTDGTWKTLARPTDKGLWMTIHPSCAMKTAEPPTVANDSAGPTSTHDRLKELAALKNGWHDGQGLAIAPEIVQWVGKVLAEMPSDLPTPHLFPMMFEPGISVEWHKGNDVNNWYISALFGKPKDPVACSAVQPWLAGVAEIEISKDHAKELTNFLRGLK